MRPAVAVREQTFEGGRHKHLDMQMEPDYRAGNSLPSGEEVVIENWIKRRCVQSVVGEFTVLFETRRK